MSKILDDLRWRGLVADTTDADALDEFLASGSGVFYTGFDATGPSLHVGHLVQIITMSRLQRAGHRPIALVGGATGLIGDPKAESERPLAEAETVQSWTDRLRAQMEPYFEFEGPTAARLVNNLDWTRSMSALDFLRDVGKHFSVNRMLDRDAVRTRLASAAGLSYTEFSYVLLQSNDYVRLFERYDCRLQIGGSDQWGNITAGVELVRRTTGAAVHALTTPLLTKSDGTKFGKTEGGGIWLDPEMTSPYEFYQYWFNADDRDVVGYLRALTFLGRDEIDALEAQTADRPAARAAQRALAQHLTTLVHGADATASAEQASAALFGKGELGAVDERTLTQALQTAPHGDLDGGLPSYVDALVASGLVASKAAARRTIKEGGAYLNNRRIEDVEGDVASSDVLPGGWLVLRRGRRNVAGVHLTRG